MPRSTRYEFKPWQRGVAAIVLPPAFVATFLSLESCSSGSAGSSVAATSAPSTASPNRSPSVSNSPETSDKAFTQAQDKLGQYGRRCKNVNAVSSSTSYDNYGNPVTTRSYSLDNVDLTCSITMAPNATSSSVLEQVTVTRPDGIAYQIASALDDGGNVNAVYVTKIKNGSDGQTQTFVKVTSAGLGGVEIAYPGKQPEPYSGDGDASTFVGGVYADLEQYLPAAETAAFTLPMSVLGVLAMSRESLLAETA